VIAAVVGPFAEAVRATVQPCSFLLIVPAVTAVAAARASWQALLWVAGATVLGGWALVANEWILDGWWLRLSAVAVMVGLVALAAGWEHAWVAGAIAVIASQWWRPCVGDELGAILNGAQDGIAGELVPMTAYMFGVTLPVAAIVAVRYAFEPPPRLLTQCTRVFAAIGVVIAGFLVAGRHESVTTTLTRWTLE
jgi:cytochrome c-type biogenesis protein